MARKTVEKTAKVKEKFQEQREEAVKLNAIRPLNDRQAEYMRLIEEKSVIVASGIAGTSKTFIPTALACDKFRTGQIKSIVFCRPAISNSKSIGYLKGSLEDKMKAWLMPVIQILNERIGPAALEIAIKREQVIMLPLEYIKGTSFVDTWIIADESEDCQIDEIKKIVTRIGKGSKLILAGDQTQSELKEKSGLKWLIDFSKRQKLGKHFGFVDFDLPEHICRSDVVKDFILALHKDEQQGKADRLYSLEHKYD